MSECDYGKFQPPAMNAKTFLNDVTFGEVAFVNLLLWREK